MVSKTKRALALVLTAMMAASALAGCNPGNSGNSGGGSTNSTASTGGDTSTAATGDGDTSTSADSDVSAIDLDDPEIIATIKDKIAEEAAKTDNKIKLELWCAADDNKFEKTRVEAFKEKYADSRYELTVKIKTAYGEDKAGAKINESPKDGADVFNIADDQLSSLVNAKSVAQVGDIFYNNVLKYNTADSVEVCSVDGTAYAFPKTSDNGYFMYYDKRVFGDDEVGNLDEMIAKANSQGKSVFMSLGNGWYNAGFYFAAGCEITYKDGVQKATFNTDEGLNAAKAMCHVAESVDKGFIGSAGSQGENATVQQGFADGTLAAAVIGTWCGPAIKEAIGADNVGAAKLPTALINGEQVQLHSFGGYKLIAVNAFTQYPMAAQTLAYFLSNAESQIARYETRGFIPTSTEALENETIKNDPARKAIEAQQPYSHAQGQSVSGKFWATNVGGFGGEIVTAKGKISDDQLKKSLQDLVTQIEGD